MILPTLLSCVIMVSAAPTSVPSPVLTPGEATQGPNQTPDVETAAPPTPQVQQPDPYGGFHLLSPSEQLLWSPVGGTPVFLLLQPLISPPLLSSPFVNQLDSTLSSFSSEEFEVGIYLSTALTDPSAATIQLENQAAGLQNQMPAQQTPVPTSSGPPVDTNRVPAGSGAAAEKMAAVHRPAGAKLLPPTPTSV
uniref:Uncharacterized protein n=1 Tax=Tetraodon nigroviridis TaxID=99883 RepID=H3C3N1_TETNG